MANFVLQPCHLREGKFAPIKGSEPLSLGWKELVTKLAPSRERTSLMNLRAMQAGAYVGLTKREGKVTNFLLLNQDRSAKLDWVLKKDPSFELRLVEVYRVDEAQWDATVHEFDTPGLPPWGR